MSSNSSRKLKTNKDQKITVNKTMQDYSKEELFVQKAAIAQEILTKYGFPKEASTSK